MSLLFEHGHVDAMSYPLGRVYDEANFITERQNARMSTEALLLQQAVGALLEKKVRKQFTKTLKSLNVTTGPIRPSDPAE